MASLEIAQDRALNQSEKVLRSHTPYNNTVADIISKSKKRFAKYYAHEHEKKHGDTFVGGYLGSEMERIEKSNTKEAPIIKENPIKHHLLELFREEYDGFDGPHEQHEVMQFKGRSYTLLENAYHNNTTVVALAKRVTNKNIILYVTETFDKEFHRFSTLEESETQIVVKDIRTETNTYKVSVAISNPKGNMLRQIDKLIAKYQISPNLNGIDVWENLI